MLNLIRSLGSAFPLAFLRAPAWKRTCSTALEDHTSTWAFRRSPFHPVASQICSPDFNEGTSHLKYSSSVDAKAACKPGFCFVQAPGSVQRSEVYSGW